MAKNKKVWLISAAVLLLLGAVVCVLLARADTFLGKKITEFIDNSTDGKYRISYDELDVSLFPAAITVTQIQFYSPDSIFLNIQDSLLLRPQVKAAKLHISGIGLFSLIFNDKLQISRIRLEEPEISLKFHTASDSLTSIEWKTSSSGEMAYELVELEIVEGGLTWNNEKGKILETAYEIRARRILGGASEADTAVQAESAQVVLKNSTLYTSDKLMAVHFDSAGFEYSSGKVGIFGINIYSLYDKYELSQVVQHQIDWMSVEIEQIAMQLMDPAQSIRDEKFHIPQISVNGLNGWIFKDKRWPFPAKPDKPMPHQLVEGIPFQLIIDSILVKNSNIVYEEYVEKANEPGHVAFRDLEARLMPLRNDTSMMASFDARAMIMGEGQLVAHFDIPLRRGAGKYSASGSLGKMQMKSVNAILHHSAGVSIESGQVDNLKFNFTYDEQQSEGKVQFAYSDLKVQLLDRGGDGVFSNLGEDIGSWVVNSFIAKTDNIPGDKFREGLISTERNPKKSIFNYWWKSLFSGLRSSITPGEKKE